MRIKSLLFTAILTVALLCSGGFVQAVDNSALIAQLQGQIASLMAQLKVLQGNQGVGVGTWCHDFNNSMGVGSRLSSDDAIGLENALEREKLVNPPNSLSLDIPRFGEDIAATIVKFQQKYGINATGFVGPVTRAKLNKLYGCKATPETGCSNLYWFDNTNKACQTQKQFCGAFMYYGLQTFSTQSACLSAAGTSTQPSITVTSPNGGESWQLGTAQTISWNPSYKCSIGMPCAVSSNVTISLIGNLSGCYNISNNVACLPVLDPVFTLASNVSNSGNYQWKVGDFSSVKYGTTISAGNYIVKICENLSGATKCDISNANFTITSGSTSIKPTITSISPSTVNIGSQVEINGTGFTTASDNSICYAGVIGGCYLVSAESSTKIKWTVPYAEFPRTVGIIVKNINGESAAYRSLSIVNKSLYISSLSQNAVKAGDAVTINGTGFYGFSAGINKIYVGTTEVTPTSSSETSLQFSVPALTVGAYETYVKNSTGDSNKITLNIIQSDCVPNWNCSAWSGCPVCTGGFCPMQRQTRTCSDLNNCGTTTNKPDTVKYDCSI